MSNTSAAQEPSMEEILASIRRIISDEEAAIGEEAAPAEDNLDVEEEMSQDDLDALFDSPAPADEPEEDDMAAAMAGMDDEPEPPVSEDDDDDDVLELQTEWQESGLVEPQDDDLVFAEEAMEESEPDSEPEVEAFAQPDPVPSLEQAINETLEKTVPPLLKATIETSPTPDGPLPAINAGQPLVSDATSAMVTNAFGDLTHTILSNNTRTMENVVEDMLRPMLKAWLDQNLPVMVERLVRAEIERVSRGEPRHR